MVEFRAQDLNVRAAKIFAGAYEGAARLLCLGPWPGM